MSLGMPPPPLLLLLLTTWSLGRGGVAVKPTGTFEDYGSDLLAIRCSARDVVADGSERILAVDLRRTDDNKSYLARVQIGNPPEIQSYTDRLLCSVSGAAGKASSTFLQLTCLVSRQLDLAAQELYCDYGPQRNTSSPSVTPLEATVLECSAERPRHAGGSQLPEAQGDDVLNVIISLPTGLRFKSKDSGEQLVRDNRSTSVGLEVFHRKAEEASKVSLLVVIVKDERSKLSTVDSECEVEIGNRFFSIAATPKEHSPANGIRQFPWETAIGAFLVGAVFTSLVSLIIYCCVKRKANKSRRQKVAEKETNDVSKRDDLLANADEPRYDRAS